MRAFLKYLGIQFRMDLRDRGVLMTYYLVPLVFYVVVGSVFSSTNPLMKPTLAASMSIFAISMGAVMGTPIPIVRAREAGTLRAFRVNGIPGAATLGVQAVSAFLHLLLVSALIYAVSPALLHAAWPSFPARYAAVLLIFLAATVGVGLLIGACARSQQAATMLSMLVFFPSVLLGGIMFPASMLPGALRGVGEIFPATQAMRAFAGMAYGGRDGGAGTALAVLSAMGLLAFALACLCFARQLRDE